MFANFILHSDLPKQLLSNDSFIASISMALEHSEFPNYVSLTTQASLIGKVKAFIPIPISGRIFVIFPYGHSKLSTMLFSGPPKCP